MEFVLSPTFLGSLLAAFVLGLSKAGIKGITIIIVTILALIHGGKVSTGILLPMLIFADILAVSYYRKETQWQYLFKVLPWALIGVVIGAFLGKDMPEFIFKQLMAIIILVTVVIMIFWEYKKVAKVPSHWIFASTMGLLAGITTMIGNLAGAFSNVYFLAMRLPKNHFIGTAAYLFFIINLFKLPFHIFMWETVNMTSITLSLKLLPAVLLGFILGVRIVKLITDQWYRKIILFLTAIGAIIIYFQ